MALPLLAAVRCEAGLLPGHPFSNAASGTTSAAFLKLPNGARYEALGGAAAAFASGPEALFWNPAGLVGSGQDLSLSYGALLESAYEGAAAYRLSPLGPVSLALGAQYLSQSALTSFDSVGDPTGSFAPYDLALTAGAGMPLGGLRLGAAAKLIHSSLADQSATTAAVDLGLQADHVSDVGDGPLDLGASLSNLGPGLKLGSVASPLPLTIRGGAAWHASPNFNFLLDLLIPVDQDPYVCIGGEARLPTGAGDYLLRMGFNQAHAHGIDGLTGLTLGAGFDWPGLRLDYAWVPYGDLGMTHRVTLAFRL
ncbi:MAG: PorV/PorQ family protein [Elusimicrobia bacterium]|nr:PorV/PorQ family protein [Elusimicrobiota bacterium]MDE2426362.1 PorV/PorQ family protein [Elusimicrobiota bacterium]